MLARDFLSAKSLGISEIERQAAIELLRRLESGSLEFMDPEQQRCEDRLLHYKVNGEDIITDVPNDPRLQGYNLHFVGYISPTRSLGKTGGFNMGHWGMLAGGVFCGCMGGWMERIKGRQISDRCFDRWSDLFEPPDLSKKNAKDFTPDRCAWALRTKLSTGKADWST